MGSEGSGSWLPPSRQTIKMLREQTNLHQKPEKKNITSKELPMWEIRTDLLHAGGRQQLSSKCVSLPQNAGDLVGLFYKKLLQASLKSICLVKEFFLANQFIVVFWGILRQVSQQLPRKIPLIFGICFIILPTCCCYLVVHQLIKLHWNCISASQIYCSSCCSLPFSLSIWPNM